MIIEFVGSTGAGKTTLINEVYKRLGKKGRVKTSVELATNLLGLKYVKNPTLQNLVQEFISFPFLFFSLNKYIAYLSQSMKLFWRNTRFSMQTIHNLRSLERKVGMEEIIRKYHKNEVILVDEGPILALHMFVSNNNSVDKEEVLQFIGLIPVPDLVIYIRASVDTLIKRTRHRSDPPREVHLNNLAQMEAYFTNAVTIFDQLITAKNMCDRLLIIESLDFSDQNFDQVVERICQRILEKTSILQKNSIN